MLKERGAHDVGAQAKEALQNQRLHMIAEQRELLEAADRDREVERNRWSTELQYQKDGFRRAMHERKAINEGAVGKQIPSCD